MTEIWWRGRASTARSKCGATVTEYTSPSALLPWISELASASETPSGKGGGLDAPFPLNVAVVCKFSASLGLPPDVMLLAQTSHPRSL